MNFACASSQSILTWQHCDDGEMKYYLQNKTNKQKNKFQQTESVSHSFQSLTPSVLTQRLLAFSCSSSLDSVDVKKGGKTPNTYRKKWGLEINE